MKIDKTLRQVATEIEAILENHNDLITSAFENNCYDLNLTIKVNLKGNREKIAITPTLEFYPEPKFKTDKQTITVDENQLVLPLSAIKSEEVNR